MDRVDISIVVPLLNEEESLPELCSWIKRVCEEKAFSYEIILVDDGSTDKSWEVILDIKEKDSNVRGIKFRRNYGKSAALNVGFEAATGDIVITMDADLQDSPEEIPELYRMVMEDNYDLVSGWKKKRHDPISKTVPSKFFNAFTRRMSGIKLHDFNCGLKAYKNEVVKNIEVYGEMHRYIPVIAKWEGFTKIGEKVVQHQARKYGSSKFTGLKRAINGFLDIISISFIGRFGKAPMHFFGLLGTFLFFMGFVVALYIGGVKIYRLSNQMQTTLVTDNPYFYIALTIIILGTMLFLVGFLAELINQNNPRRSQYKVESRI
ncbi:glycosyltransferase family 2 protein [Portibacter marinus]|uniref:glycosyltransferase family 2 protein n=1 Tax=Portibacter marinus TaxID=2898660 RepID=UPI001F32655E|nr:glycosyltransferase [Portibacter marinus]